MPEFPTLRHTISDIRMRYAPDRATAKGACSDFSYLYRSNLQHRHDPADRIHTTPPHPRVSPRHGRNHGQPAAAARRRAGASLHQTHLRRSFDQRKRRSRRPHGPLGHLRPAGPRARILLRPHARRRRRYAGARQIDARRRIADNSDYGRPVEPRSVAGRLPVRVPQSRRRTQDRRHGRRLTERISTFPVTIRINIGSTFSGKFVFCPIHNTLRFSKSFPVKGYGTSESAGLPSSRCGSTMCRTPLALSKAMISGPVKILRQTDFP